MRPCRGRWIDVEMQQRLADAHVWTLRDERATHLRTYLDRTEALEAAGLSE